MFKSDAPLGAGDGMQETIAEALTEQPSNLFRIVVFTFVGIALGSYFLILTQSYESASHVSHGVFHINVKDMFMRKTKPSHPHILLFLADDLGWNDVGMFN